MSAGALGTGLTYSPFIYYLTVLGIKYPLYDITPQANPNATKCYFSLGKQSIWYNIGQTFSSQVYPCGLTKDAKFDVELDEKELSSIAQKIKTPYFLTAKYEGIEVITPIRVESTGSEISGLSLVETLIVNGKPKSLPWMFKGDLTWIISGGEAASPQYFCNTPVELYIFPSNLPPFYVLSGIPLSLLRMDDYLKAWMELDEQPSSNTKVDWPTFVVRTLFNDKRLKYENFRGCSRYTSWEIGRLDYTFAREEGIYCWLDFFVSDCLSANSSNSVFLVNCYDLAALCQALASLGVDAASSNIRMNYMDPFGFINKTSLIGRKEAPPNDKNPDNKCNNPSYGSPGVDPRMLTEQDAPNRSAFFRHMFLTIDEGGSSFVLDACVGPETGTRTLQDYITAAIDHGSPTPQQYLGTRAGTIGDIVDGPGVSRTVTSRCLSSSSRGSILFDSTILNTLRLTAPAVVWLQPYVASPVESRYVSATYKFVDLQTLEICTINVFKYGASDYMAVNEYVRRRTSIRNVVETSSSECFSDDGDGSIRMWYNIYGNGSYLCIVETELWKSNQTGQIKRILESVLQNALSTPTPSFIESITQSKAGAIYNVGDQIVLTLKFSQIAIGSWRGLTAKVFRGKVLLMESKEITNPTNPSISDQAELTFLARSNGNEVVEIVVHGSRLDSSSHLVKFWII